MSDKGFLASLRAWRRERLAKRFIVSSKMWRRVEGTLPFLDFLPAADRQPLREMALAFLADKEFSGGGDFELTDEIRLSIALQASLPVLKLGLDRYAGWVGIIVYPGDFLVPRVRTDFAGVVHEYTDTLLGEAWQGGPVLISWSASNDPRRDGSNVILHEFAHKLDMEDGPADGLPRLDRSMNAGDWASAFSTGYRAFRHYLNRGGESWLDPYAAASPAEFFAVTSEAFFEQPVMLQEDLPEIYAQLARFYRQDPAAGARRIGMDQA